MKGLALSLALCAIGLVQADQVELTRSGNICHCNPAEAPIICAQDQTDSLLIIHQNCNQFYKCNHGQNVSYFCPSPLLYNPFAEACDWPDNVDCGDRPIVLIPETDDNDVNDGGHGNNNTIHCDPSQAPTICAADGSSGTFIAHDNCNQYYMCTLGKPVVFSCANGLVYNPYTARCDWPFNVDCGDKPIVEVEDWSPDACTCDPSQAPTICATAEDGTTVGHENCNQFYQCINGVPVTQTCPNGLLFNPCIGSCDSPHNVECGDRLNQETESETCNCNPEEAPAICKENGSDGVLIAHEKCNKFYKCVHGINVPHSCPGELLYDPYLQICNWPASVKCGNRPIGSGSNDEHSDGEDSKGDDENSEDGNSQDGNGEINSDENGNGEGSGDTGTCNCNPEEAPAICETDGSDGVLIAHEKCNKFYKCANGINVPLRCPGDLLYDPKLQICNWPEKVDCGKRPIDNGGNGEDENGENNNGEDSNGEDNNGEDSDGEDNNGEDSNGEGSGDTGTCNCNPEEAPAICEAEGSDGILIAHEKCNKFYKCTNGINVPLRCPGDLLYDPKLQICNWPEKVDCGKRPIDNGGNGEDENGEDSNGEDNNGEDNNGEDGNGEGSGDTGTCNCNPEEASAICEAEGSDGILIAHEKCNKFYKCDNGINVPLRCPGDLLYDPKLQICNWPQNVECGGRPIDNGSNGEDCNDDDNNGEDGNGQDGNGEDSNGEDNNGENNNGEDGNGEGSGDTGTCNCNPEEAPAICEAEGSDGILIAHEKCNKFYKCTNGINVPLSCPGELLYDPKLQICNWPQNVECGDRPKEIQSEEENKDEVCTDEGESINCNCVPGEAPRICRGPLSDGLLVAHENCNQFYQCAQGLPVTVSCSNGLLFNTLTQRCDWPHDVECGDRPIVEIETESEQDEDDKNDGNEVTCNCNPAEAPAICSSGNSEGVLIAHEYCNKFYKCSFGSPLAFACSGALLYNPHIKACDWPYNVDCGDREILQPDPEQEIGGGGGDENNETVEANCDPSQAPAICASAGSNGVLVAHENCNKYYVCASGSPVALYCNPNLLFNPANGQCDWPSNVDCGDRFIAEPEIDDGPCLCKSREAPSICAGSDSNGKMIAHEACGQYYVCFNGKPIARSCPRGLFYEPHTKQCNSPAQVSCDGRDVSAHLSINKHMLAQTRFF